MHSLMYNSRNGRILMGGMQEKLLEFDVATAKETRAEIVEGGTCAILREHRSRFICCGDATAGKIYLRDPHSLTGNHATAESKEQTLVFSLSVYKLLSGSETEENVIP